MTEHRPEEPESSLGMPEDAAAPSGATPPAESGVSGLAAPEKRQLRRGWGPVPLVLIFVIVALVAVGLIAMAIALIA